VRIEISDVRLQISECAYLGWCKSGIHRTNGDCTSIVSLCAVSSNLLACIGPSFSTNPPGSHQPE